MGPNYDELGRKVGCDKFLGGAGQKTPEKDTLLIVITESEIFICFRVLGSVNYKEK